MSVQTDKNSAILVAEYAVKRLCHTFKFKLGFRPNKSKNELDSLFNKVESSLMTLKYSYLSLDELKSHPEINSIEKATNDLRDAVLFAKKNQSTNKMAYSTIKWGISILLGLSNRLEFSNNILGTGVDIKVLRIRNIQHLDQLVQTRAYDKENEYTIMTNLSKIKPNINLAAAILPPAEIGGQISEAMYLGLEERTEDAGSIINPASVNLNEVNAILHQLLSKKG